MKLHRLASASIAGLLCRLLALFTLCAVVRAQNISLTKPPTFTAAGANSSTELAGLVTGTNDAPENLRIVVFALGDRWYVQPTAAAPYTQIQADGSWAMKGHASPSCYRVLLVNPSSFSPSTYPASTAGVLKMIELKPDTYASFMAKAGPSAPAIVAPQIDLTKNTATKPTIAITSTPQKGVAGDLKGLVSLPSNDSAANYKVLVFLTTTKGSGYWVKPTADRPFTALKADGSFTCQVVSHPNDLNAEEFVVFLVKKDYSTETLTDIASLDQTELAKEAIARASKERR